MYFCVHFARVDLYVCCDQVSSNKTIPYDAIEIVHCFITKNIKFEQKLYGDSDTLE